MDKKHKQDVAYVVAARAWCHEGARSIIVSPELAEVFAEILRQVGDSKKMVEWVKNPPREIELLNMDIVGSSEDLR